MASLRCLVIDDDATSRTVLSRYVEQHAQLELIGTCESGVEAVNWMEQADAPIDLLLLDVHMPMMTGLELAETLTDTVQVIIVTGDRNHAVDAFDADAIDYLVKPVRYARFAKAVARAYEQHKQRQALLAKPEKPRPQAAPPVSDTAHPESVFVKVDGRLIRLALADIRWVEAQGDYMMVHTAVKRYLIHSTMKNLAAKLPDDQFVRVHRSHIVRIDQIKDIENSTLVIDGKMIPIGGSYYDALIERIQTL
jgi:DNA-binding LytR/AlgR family response regulator